VLVVILFCIIHISILIYLRVCTSNLLSILFGYFVFVCDKSTLSMSDSLSLSLVNRVHSSGVDSFKFEPGE
jgi:hypothetical protein